METNSKKKTVFLSAITSDIGIALAERYSREGYIITGTYRSTVLLHKLKALPDCYLFYCDLEEEDTIRESVRKFAELGLTWETFISCASWPLPLQSFFSGDFAEWSRSVHVNAIEQFKVLHALHPFRDREAVSNVVFFAGPGTNNAPKNYSALTIAKIMLFKMCELLHEENKDLNVFIVGPGWTKTKTHEIILSDPNVSPEKYKETLEFMQNRKGTSMDEIYDCIRWLSLQGREAAGGRNFSVVHDYWNTDELAKALQQDEWMYKLRRHGNDWKDKGDPKK